MKSLKLAFAPIKNQNGSKSFVGTPKPKTMMLFAFVVLSLVVCPTDAYMIGVDMTKRYHLSGVKKVFTVNWRLQSGRYGPPDDDNAPLYSPTLIDKDSESGTVSNRESPLIQQEAALRGLIDKILAAQDPNHIPSLLTKNLDVVLSLSNSGNSGVQIIESILQETQSSQGEATAVKFSEAIELIVSFAEQFVQEAVHIDDQNKRLLGKIIMIVSDKDKTTSVKEQTLDDFFEKEKGSFTAGFLRHLEGECQRIATAPQLTPESIRLLEIMRMIQTRVLEEAGSSLGEAAQVLGQLIGYPSSTERLAVLDAGLAVRGPAFARELLDLTEEAIDGFSRVAGGADADLVECIREIDARLKSYLQGKDGFE
jgi:hypothetical protein